MTKETITSCKNLTRINLFDNASRVDFPCDIEKGLCFSKQTIAVANQIFDTDLDFIGIANIGSGVKRFCQILTAIEKKDEIFISSIEKSFNHNLFPILIKLLLKIAIEQNKIFYISTYNEEFLDYFRDIYLENRFDLAANKILNKGEIIRPLLIAEKKMELIYKYAVGETVYVQSRYDGVLATKIVSCVQHENKSAYELQDEIVVHKDGHSIGSKVQTSKYADDEEFEEDEDSYWVYPCPEKVIMKIGDFMVDTHPFFFGEVTDKILTKEMVKTLKK